MTLEQIEQMYKNFVKDIKAGEEWSETKDFIFGVLSWYNIKTPKALNRCEIIRSDGTIRGNITSIKQMDRVYKAIDKLKLINV